MHAGEVFTEIHGVEEEKLFIYQVFTTFKYQEKIVRKCVAN